MKRGSPDGLEEFTKRQKMTSVEQRHPSIGDYLYKYDRHEEDSFSDYNYLVVHYDTVPKETAEEIINLLDKEQGSDRAQEILLLLAGDFYYHECKSSEGVIESSESDDASSDGSDTGKQASVPPKDESKLRILQRLFQSEKIQRRDDLPESTCLETWDGYGKAVYVRNFANEH